MTDRPDHGPIPAGLAPAPPGEPPVEHWEAELGQRRAERLAAVVARLLRTGASSGELSGALLPRLRALSDRQCVMLERELDAVLADLAAERE